MDIRYMDIRVWNRCCEIIVVESLLWNHCCHLGALWGSHGGEGVQGI